jgi:hypothetical protein
VARDEGQYDQQEMIRMLEEEMLQAANNLEFEKAADIRDKLKELKSAPQITSNVDGHDVPVLADTTSTPELAGLKPMTPQQKKVRRVPKSR